GIKELEIDASSLLEVINKLNEKFPGIKFRFIDEHDNIREHMKIFVNKEQVNNTSMELNHDDEIFIIQALSGG
ncbi:MAG: MoaD/ThiS family protein, partial [Candidatus Kariarchaeaceae archaeon]